MFKRLSTKKSAMTLAELLIVFTIMGVVAGLMVMTAKPSDKSYKYIYTRIYNALGTAYYNASQNTPKYIKDNDSDPTKTKMLYNDFPVNGKIMCKLLLEYINDTTGGVSSTGTTSACATIQEASTTNINNAAKVTTLLASNPDIITSNGIRLWIANAGTTTEGGKTYQYSTLSIPVRKVNAAGNALTTASTTDFIKVRYYVVVADLNGKMKPNVIADATHVGDIVAFALTENSDVIPLGRPEIDKRYLAARVAYSTAHGTEEADVGTSEAVTFYEARRRAWAVVKYDDDSDASTHGVYPHPDETFSLNFNGTTGGVSSASPFYINYTNTQVKAIMPDAIRNETYDTTNCSKPSSTGGSTVFDTDGCYVRVDDFS